MAYVPKYVKLQRESTYKGSLITGESNVFFVDIVDESMNPDQGFIDAETAGYLEPRLRLPGGYLVDGDIGLIVDAHSAMPFLHALFGSYQVSTNSVVTGSNLYSFVFKPVLRPLTMRTTINPNVEDTFGGGSYKGRALRGNAIRSIEVAASAREACTMSISSFAAKDVQVDRDATVTFPTIRPFSFTDGVLSQLGGADIAVEALTLRAERIVADDNFALGSRFLPFLHAAGMTVSGSLDLGFREWATFKKFWGSAAATEPAAAPLPYTLALKFKADVCGPKWIEMDIDCPRIYLDTTNANIDRRERIIQSVDFTGLYDITSGYAIRVTIWARKKLVWKPG